MDIIYLSIVLACVCITGITTNGYLLCMFCRGTMKTSMPYQLQWLSAVDTVFLVTVLINLPMKLAFDIIFDWIILPVSLSDFIIPFLQFASYTASIWLTVFVACHRYLALCHPHSISFRKVKNHGKKYAVRIVVLSIMYSLVAMCIETLNYGNHGKYKPWQMEYIMFTIIGFAFPFILLIYVSITHITLLKPRERIRRRILIAVLIIFLVCHFPGLISRLRLILEQGGHITSGMSDLALVLASVHSATNGFIYFSSNKHFQTEFIGHCRCRRRTPEQNQMIARM